MSTRWIWLSAVTSVALLGLAGGWNDNNAHLMPEMTEIEPVSVATEFTLAPHSLSQDEVVELNMHCWQGHERACLILQEFRQSASQTVGNTGAARYCRTSAKDCAAGALLWRG